SFVGGKNATGTVWADDFLLTGRGGNWAGQDWNTGVGVPTGWYYWLPPNGGNDGLLSNGFENTVVTNEASHSGAYSLKFNMPAGRAAHDGFVGTKRFPLNSGNTTISEGDIMRVSVWIKASGLVPDSAAKYPGTWAVGITPLWFAKYGNNDGYNNVGPATDYTFTFPNVTSFDWTQYTEDIVVPAGVNATALETRLHIYSTFVGTVYFDDLTVQKVGTTTTVQGEGTNTPKVFDLSNNYPNPFNPSTTINYSVPTNGIVSLVVYNILGQQVRTLVNAPMNAGRYSIVWDGRGEAGSVLSSGVYLYRLQAGSMAIVKKMLLLK
ncbi:MAG TPA: T9SS type A sorting domain-containing protein, partial [Bacteroidota bacterium]|nr:T9SS type A sorting domain-containing protein [Bacteroidota bacterium]